MNIYDYDKDAYATATLASLFSECKHLTRKLINLWS